MVGFAEGVYILKLELDDTMAISKIIKVPEY
jgi:hypothetical protein